MPYYRLDLEFSGGCLEVFDPSEEDYKRMAAEQEAAKKEDSVLWEQNGAQEPNKSNT